MRTVVHLSDLHFDALDERLLAPLRETVVAANPDLLVVSGDLTQRARPAQFQHAREFLDTLPFTSLVVPGNHDVPLFDLAARLFDPFGAYRRYISADTAPVHADDEMIVVGLNSARSWAFRHGPGRLNAGQILSATARLNMAPPNVLRVVVTHHPFDLPDTHGDDHLIGRAHLAVSWLSTVKVDVFLAGHLHVSHIGHTARRYRIAGHSALVVQAGTLSHRARGEANSFNVLHLDAARIVIERQTWRSGEERFECHTTDVFERGAAGWLRMEVEPGATCEITPVAPSRHSGEGE